MKWEVEIMRSKASYFSISKPLVVENLRRFWAIPALAFLVYFLSGVFPILMSYRDLSGMARYIAESLNNQQHFYMFAHLIFPAVAAVVIFKYLQGVSSVSVMHSMPFTRAKLYNSGFLSGLILIAAPILANGLILLAISKPAYSRYATESGLVVDTVNCFARADILNWIWVSLLIAFSIYAVSVFAGIVTGNSLMHFATALWFNFLIPALYAIFIVYFSYYLYGFNTSGNWTEFGLWLSPFLNVLQTEGAFGAGAVIFYIVSFFILYGISLFFYRKRKLERATDALAFGFMELIICFLIAFFGMTLLGLYFGSLGESEMYMYAGLASGTVIFFIIGRMIVKKTPRIFNGQSLKSFGVYALIAVLFILSLRFDVTGFEKRVPSPDNVKNFTMSEDFALGAKTGIYDWNSSILYKSADGKGFRLKDPANIAAATALHQALIDNKSRFEKNDGSLWLTGVSLEYNPDSTFSMTRRYQMSYDFFRSSPEFRQIYESKEFKDYCTPANLNYVNLTEITVSSGIPFRDGVESSDQNVEIRSQADMKEFIACLDRDYQKQSFEEMVSLKRPYATANITFNYRNENSDTPNQLLTNTVSHQITDSYVNTIKWLSDHGYDVRFAQDAGEVDHITLYHYIDGKGSAGGNPSAAYTDDKAMPTPAGQKGLEISDPDRIQKLLDTYETQNINYKDYYYGIVAYKGGSQKDPNSAATVQIYFNEGNVPDYVLEYFK